MSAKTLAKLGEGTFQVNDKEYLTVEFRENGEKSVLRHNQPTGHSLGWTKWNAAKVTFYPHDSEPLIQYGMISMSIVFNVYCF